LLALPHVLPVHLHHVVGDENRLCWALPRSWRLEVEGVVGAQNDRLAIDDRAIDRQRRDGIADAGEGFGNSRTWWSPQALAVKRTERDLLDHLVGAGE
jgi:hypothetical protein